MVETRNEISIDLGYTCHVNVRAVPVTTVTLNLIIDEIKQLKTEVAIKGTTTGFSIKEVDAVFAWIIDYDNNDIEEFTYKGQMKIASNGNFDFTVNDKPPEISVFDHRLFGKGKIGYRISPKYPHAPSAIVPSDESQFTFNNKLQVSSSVGGKSALDLGTLTFFNLEMGELANELIDNGDKVVLYLKEADNGDKESLGNDNFSANITWDKDTKSVIYQWYIGCTMSSYKKSPMFSFPEWYEEGDTCEYSYKLCVERQKNKKIIKKDVTYRDEKLFTMLRPELSYFRLACEYLERKNAPGKVPTINVIGNIDNIHEDLSVSVRVTLWKAKSPWIFEPVGDTKIAHVENGIFIVSLCEFSVDTQKRAKHSLAKWLIEVNEKNILKEEPVFFATVRFHEVHLKRPNLPLRSSLIYDVKKFRPFSESRGRISKADLYEAKACCSQEAIEGYEPVRNAIKRLDLKQ
ncbi:MAG: hypothetical protein JW841_11225 [Deltaproteobacteria bacterium]|nr:hypothetical protein [Deltaproteobacteria bacterium]